MRGNRRRETATLWGVAVGVRVMGLMGPIGLMGRMGVLFYFFARGVKDLAGGEEVKTRVLID